jgi:hypothetical protein
MEAAIALARQPGTTVVVSYRGATFARGRARNVAEMKRLTARGDMRIVFESTVARVDARHVILERRGSAESTAGAQGAPRQERVPYDQALVLIGGTPSFQLLRSAGVQLVAQVVESKPDLPAQIFSQRRT